MLVLLVNVLDCYRSLILLIHAEINELNGNFALRLTSVASSWNECKQHRQRLMSSHDQFINLAFTCAFTLRWIKLN